MIVTQAKHGNKDNSTQRGVSSAQDKYEDSEKRRVFARRTTGDSGTRQQRRRQLPIMLLCHRVRAANFQEFTKAQLADKLRGASTWNNTSRYARVRGITTVAASGYSRRIVELCLSDSIRDLYRVRTKTISIARQSASPIFLSS